MEMPDEIYDQLNEHCERGEALLAKGDADAALEQYQAAEALIPSPKLSWEAALWVYAAIGDAWFAKQDFDRARQAFSNAVLCPDGLGNPFIHLRLGQCQFEENNLDKAADELTRAYMAEGLAIFEDENPKYLAFLRTRIDLT
ncbi:tetratricopeptide repeat protein [Bremerella cremea]|uniref:tetratricopeptide repeat protein n=1 Tax=Bremerella cremea TaxID=1031537 RepID=UPI0031E9631A